MKNRTHEYIVVATSPVVLVADKLPLPKVRRVVEGVVKPVSDELLQRLNRLVKTRPFCHWHRVRKNDPL